MYYANKQTFYVRQYGPAVIISVISLILIASGIFIYTKSSNPTQIETANTQTVEQNIEENEVTENVENTVKEEGNDLQESNALIDESKLQEESKEEVVKYFENLPTFEKSKEVNVISVNPSGTVTVEKGGDKLEITLIGIDYKYSKGEAVNKITTDLLNKKVKVAFDTVRSNNNVNYAYIYRDNKVSYNAELLKTGLVTLKSERKNTKLNKELADAQAYARSGFLGAWKK